MKQNESEVKIVSDITEKKAFFEKHFKRHPEKYEPLFSAFFPKLAKALKELEED